MKITVASVSGLPWYVTVPWMRPRGTSPHPARAAAATSAAAKSAAGNGTTRMVLLRVGSPVAGEDFALVGRAGRPPRGRVHRRGDEPAAAVAQPNQDAGRPRGARQPRVARRRRPAERRV